MHDKTTPAQTLLDIEVQAAKTRGVADPFGSCSGLRWIRNRIAEKPGMTAEDLREAFEKETDGSRGAWALVALQDQHDLLYPSFAASLFAAMSVSQTKVFISNSTMRQKLSAASKTAILRKLQDAKATAAIARAGL